jgi:hypothetical protein
VDVVHIVVHEKVLLTAAWAPEFTGDDALQAMEAAGLPA